MKVNIDNILGSAKRVRGQMHQDERPRGGERREVRSDSVSIESRVNSRISSIQQELRDVQSSLTRNQTIQDGIGRLREDFARGGEHAARILDETMFEGTPVLRNFLGDRAGAEALAAGGERVASLIGDDVAKLRRLQVEAENLSASNLPGTGNVGRLMSGIEASLDRADPASLERLTSLNPDTVRRLIK